MLWWPADLVPMARQLMDEVHITGDGLQTRSGIFRIEWPEQVIFSVFKHVNGPCLGGVP